MPDDQPIQPPAELGDEGKRALDAERTRAKAAEARVKELEPLAAKARELEDANRTEVEKLTAALAEKDGQLNSLPRQIRSQVLAFASAASQLGFVDPEDALAFLPDDVDLSDKDAVKAALSALAERKPHLVRQEKPKPKPAGRASAPGDKGDGDKGEKNLEGKERAAAALRAFSQTRP